ncbi:MAG TPA: ABC transporter substrate-binding protein [Stellaceae bacterium]|nr:ABC transporter substrate-binding protein [Stellaceae bacterium]
MRERARAGRGGAAFLFLLAALGAAVATTAARAGETVLRFVPQADLRILDPIWTSAYITQHHAYMVYDTLFALDEHLRPQPQMVERWSVSDDQRVYTFTLRPGLKFHDGLPVLPADCIASLARWGKRDVLGQKLMARVEAMTPVDDRTFKIALKRPFPLILTALAELNGNPFIMPERLAKTDADKQVTDPIGSGPFKFVKAEWEPGHKAVYVKNPDYVPRPEKPSWVAGGKVVKVDRVEWIYLPDSATAAAALNNGEVDWWELVPIELLPVFAANKDVVVDRKPDPLGTIAILRFNHLHPPFDNPKMRQALLYAVDQREYMTAVAGDPENWRPCFAFFTCGTPMASDAGAAPLAGPRDLAKAKALIAEAGYHGEKIVLLDPSDYAIVHAESLVTADLLRRLGLTVDVATSDWGTLLARRASKEPVEKGGWTLFHTSVLGTDMLDPAQNSQLRGNGAGGWFGWPTDAKMEALREQWLDAPDEAARQRLAAAIQEEAFASVPYIPLGQFNRPTAYRRALAGVVRAPIPIFWEVAKE